MARGTDGATGPAVSKPVRVSSSGAAARPAKSVQGRQLPGFVNDATQFLRSVIAELNRVSWPDRQTVTASTVVVVFVLVVTALYLAGWDLVLAKLFQQILQP
jgi:preprotein translocase subunit SecE